MDILVDNLNCKVRKVENGIHFVNGEDDDDHRNGDLGLVLPSLDVGNL